jgi:hypothetical protein
MTPTRLAMTASNLPMTALEVTDPRSSSAADRITGLVYGTVTAVAPKAVR